MQRALESMRRLDKRLEEVSQRERQVVRGPAGLEAAEDLGGFFATQPDDVEDLSGEASEEQPRTSPHRSPGPRASRPSVVQRNIQVCSFVSVSE
jgi:hypothetical protein